MVKIPHVLVFIATFIGYLQATKPDPYAVDNLEKNQRDIYTDSWAVEIIEGGDKMADFVANRHGFNNLGKVKLKNRSRLLS